MEKLNYIVRGDAKLYCFVEVCDKLFPCFARSTVRSWLKQLDITTIFATLEERRAFKQLYPVLKSTVFGLIYENDLNRLISDNKNKMSKTNSPSLQHQVDVAPSGAANCSLVEYTDDESSDDEQPASSLVAIHTSSPLHKSFAASPRREEVASPVRTPLATGSSSHCTTPTCIVANSPLTPNLCSISSRIGTDIAMEIDVPDHTHPQAPVETAPAVTISSSKTISSPIRVDDASTTTSKRSRSPYRLSNEEAGEYVNEQVKLLLHFYTVDLNAKRNGPPLAQETKNKLVERMYCFLYFCKRRRNIVDLSLALFNDESLVSEYVDYLAKVRQLMPNTICAHLISITNVIKYNFRDDWKAFADCKALLSSRSFQRQLARQARIISKRSKEGICMKKSSQKFYFNHILDTVRNLRAQIFSSTGIQKARHLHDFVMLATYLRVNPGRSREIRSLHVFVESESQAFDVTQFLDKNVIVFRYDNTVSLIENDFKTVKSAGPRNFDLSEDETLVYFLHQYNIARPILLRAKSHSYFFLNSSGDPFKTSASLCVYLGNLFEREVSIRVSTNKLRHAIVTYFRSLEESKDIQIRESLATLMKHTCRYQEHVYDDATQQEKTEKGRELLRNKLAPDIFGDADMILSSESQAGAHALLDEEEFVLRPNVGDICALLDSASTADDVSFFIAKVARFTSDAREAHLVHLAEVDGSDALFRLAPGKVWKENVESLVYPIDIVFNESEQAYELRTSAKDIYSTVHGR